MSKIYQLSEDLTITISKIGENVYGDLTSLEEGSLTISPAESKSLHEALKEVFLHE